MVSRFALIVLLVISVGCGGAPDDRPELATVYGVVKSEGKPLANATVKFSPDGGNRPSTGLTNESGEYSLAYTADVDGAEIAMHVVTVVANTPDGDYEGDAPPPAPKLPATASDGSITREVKAGSNTIDIEL